MSDQQQIVRSVSWNEVFSFSHLFKSFKMAVHPAKLMLALAGIALTVIVGRALLDPIWSAAGCRVLPGETWAYWRLGSREDVVRARQKWMDDGRVVSLVTQAAMIDREMTPDAVRKAVKDDGFGDTVDKLCKKAKDNYDKALGETKKQYGASKEAAAKEPDEDKREEKLEQVEEARLTAERQALQAYVATLRGLSELKGQGIFSALSDWEMHCLRNALGALRRLNFAGGLNDLATSRGSMVPDAYKAAGPTNAAPFNASTNLPEGYGVVSWMVLMAWGVWWMFSMFPVYTILFLVVTLAIWSVLGGAICRMAAMHAAREEKVGVSSALKFGLSKLRHFFMAPVLPLGIIVFLGLLIALGGLIGNIAYFGELFVAIGFPLALIVGAVIAFLTVGLMIGWPLMWPTIAVEGSDSFDALSRSFSYVFNRPFRYGLYWLVAGVYGTLCYLVVRLFAFLTLKATHCWCGWAMSIADRPQYAVGAGKLDVMWAAPTFADFHGPMQFEAMQRWEGWTSVLIAFWVYLVAGVVLAFLVTFFFSAATNIYYLLRQKVDATDLDDVYIEEEEEEAVAGEPTTTPPAGGPAAPASGGPAAEQPAPPKEEEKPGEENGQGNG